MERNGAAKYIILHCVHCTLKSRSSPCQAGVKLREAAIFMKGAQQNVLY